MRGVSLREKKSAVRQRAPAHKRRFGSGGYVEYLIDPRRPHSFPSSVLLLLLCPFIWRVRTDNSLSVSAAVEHNDQSHAGTTR